MSEGQQTQASSDYSALKTQDFLASLKSRMTDYNANLLLRSALTQSGVVSEAETETFLKTEEAVSLCMQLIRQGGPAFQVGTAMYRKLQ